MEGRTPQALGQWMPWWLEHVVQHRARRQTYATYAVLSRVHIVPHLGDYDLDALTPLHVEAWMARLRSRLSGSSIHTCRAVLRRAYNDAIRYGVAATNPVSTSLPPQRDEYLVTPLTLAQARRLLESVDGTREEALYAVALAVGLRNGEIRGLRWSDVDFDAGCLRIRYQLQWYDGEPHFEAPKGKKRERRVFLAAPVVRRLKAHRQRQVEERLRAPQWQDYDLVFCQPDGTPYKEHQLLRTLRGHLKAAGLPGDMRFHDLRHSCASILIALGVPLVTIQEVLGHADFQTTRDTYIHLSDEMGRAAADLMGRFFEGEETGT